MAAAVMDTSYRQYCLIYDRSCGTAGRLQAHPHSCGTKCCKLRLLHYLSSVCRYHYNGFNGAASDEYGGHNREF